MWRAVETLPISVDAQVDAARAARIRDALLARTVPIAAWRDGRAEPRGTGAFIRNTRGVALLTAAHVLEGAGVGDLAIPATPHGGPWRRLQHARVRVLAHPAGDVALLALPDPRWSGGWRVLAAESLLAAESSLARGAAVTDTHVVAGFPSERMRRVDGVLYAKPLVVFTRPHAGAPPGCFHYGRVADRTDGAAVYAPELDGVSGALVWAVASCGAFVEGLHAAPDQASAADCVLRPAGVQVAFRHDAYLRCESLALTHDLLAHAFA